MPSLEARRMQGVGYNVCPTAFEALKLRQTSFDYCAVK